MHPSSLENMLRCYRSYIADTELEASGGVVLDVGGADVNGSYRRLFPQQFRYVTADVAESSTVDLVLTDAYSIPLANASVDIVLSGQAFEHIEYFWRTFDEMLRVLKPDGFAFLIAPSAGPEHQYPVDCYRFYPDAYRALAKRAECLLVEVWRDERGPWQDLVGVFRPLNAKPMQRIKGNTLPAPIPIWSVKSNDPDEEAIAGTTSYLELLQDLHARLKPELYLEVGVRKGVSLSLALRRAVGIDPNPEITSPLSEHTEVVSMESDKYFEGCPDFLNCDFAFIDGLHLAEQALRDFMHIERHARAGSALLIDDIFPNHPAQAERLRRTNAWTGDVWKLHEALQRWRPDLFILPIDTSPTGSLLVAGLDPQNRTLWNHYNPIVRQMQVERSPPEELLSRANAVSATSAEFSAILDQLAVCYSVRMAPSLTVLALRRALQKPTRKKHKLPLSVVIVGYNMARELPRTIQSFSSSMQMGIEEEDYELILLDNGSTKPFDESHLHALAANLRCHYVQNATQSPVAAINKGLELAEGELIGVCIDGARMASPGLLALALAASRTHHKPMIGSIAYHLGPDVQMKSVLEGYNQAVEDELLEKADWQNDGYRLFGISTLAGSSAEGWFVLPAETNALFLRKEHWNELGGFDERFQTPGGGLANLDSWRRCCDDESGQLIMLLGEATFHQVHGGVATNNPSAPQQAFHEEYEKLRGRKFEKSARTPMFFGTLRPDCIRTAHESLARLASNSGVAL